MSPRPAVAVCLVTRDSARDLPACLDSVAALAHRPLEIVLVDCGSRDGTVERARAWEAGEIPFTLIALDQNLGFAGGMNVALAQTHAPFVLTLNADVRLDPAYVSRLMERAEAHPRLRVGAVTGRLLRLPENRQAPRLDACGMRLLPTWRHLDRGSGEIDRGQWAKPERVFGATGAASLFVRRALDDVAVEGEIFDSLFHSFREDAELCFRLQERGWEVLYEPAATAAHRRWNLPRRRRQMPSEVNYHSLKNRYLLRAYHQTLGNLLWTLPATLARDLLALGYVVLRERSSLAAYGWLWHNRRRIWRRRRLIQDRRTAGAARLERWFWRRGVCL